MDATPPTAEAELALLADVVWSERAALEQLVFKLVALELVLAADLRRFVGRCLDEVDAAWELLERVEDRRAAALGALCAAWGRPAGSLRLADLATTAPEPWATVFGDHRDHLRVLAVEVDHATAENGRLCAATVTRLEDDLDTVGTATRLALADPDRGRSTAPRLRLVGSAPAPQGSLA